MIDPVAIVETTVVRAGKGVDSYVAPMREGFIKRYPVLFSLLVSFGAIAMLLGMEQMLLQYQLLQKYPFIIFSTGLVILLFTGRLYKKLR